MLATAMQTQARPLALSRDRGRGGACALMESRGLGQADLSRYRWRAVAMA